MALDWGVRAALTVFPELSSLLRVIKTRERIRQVIFTGGYPGRRETEAVFNLTRGHPPGHPEPEIFSRSAISEEVPAGLVVRVYCDLLSAPLVVPEMQRDDVGKQLKIRD